MKIVTWNLQAGFGSNPRRHDRAWHFLRALDPDVALLQEVEPPEWAVHEWAVFHGRTYNTKRWGSAVVVKRELLASEVRIEAEHKWLKEYEGAVKLATVSVDSVDVTFASVYAPAYEVKGKALEGLDRTDLTYGGIDSVWPLYQIFFDLLKRLTGSRFVVGGDFNAARLMDDVPRFVGGNRDYFHRIEEAGFVNCLRPFIESEEVQTFFQEGRRPYQLDHLHADKETFQSITSCTVEAFPVVELKLSDHAPIVAESRMNPS